MLSQASWSCEQTQSGILEKSHAQMVNEENLAGGEGEETRGNSDLTTYTKVSKMATDN